MSQCPTSSTEALRRWNALMHYVTLGVEFSGFVLDRYDMIQSADTNSGSIGILYLLNAPKL